MLNPDHQVDLPKQYTFGRDARAFWALKKKIILLLSSLFLILCVVNGIFPIFVIAAAIGYAAMASRTRESATPPFVSFCYRSSTSLRVVSTSPNTSSISARGTLNSVSALSRFSATASKWVSFSPFSTSGLCAARMSAPV